MRQGKSIEDLAKTLQDVRDNARDFVVPASKLEKMTATATEFEGGAKDLAVTIENGGIENFLPSRWAHGQVASYSEVPKQYYERIRQENPVLLADCVNHGFAVAAQKALLTRGSTGRLIRTYRGSVRALLSSRYRTMDNFDLFEAVAPSLVDLGFQVVSSELTDRRLYLKVLSERVQSEVKTGDVVQYGLVVSGSDVGCGSVRVEPMTYRLVCQNGMISEAAIRKAHLGRNIAGEDVSEFFTDRTNELTNQAFWHQVRDVVRNFAKPEFFEREVNKFREAAGQPITNYNLEQIVERTAKATKANLSEKVTKSILESLAHGSHGAGMNKWGLANAVTWAAGNAEGVDYDQATDLERLGAKVVELSPGQWRQINESE